MLKVIHNSENGFRSFVKTEPPDWEQFNEIFVECPEIMDTVCPWSLQPAHQNDQATKNCKYDLSWTLSHCCILLIESRNRIQQPKLDRSDDAIV